MCVFAEKAIFPWLVILPVLPALFLSLSDGYAVFHSILGVDLVILRVPEKFLLHACGVLLQRKVMSCDRSHLYAQSPAPEDDPPTLR